MPRLHGDNYGNAIIFFGRLEEEEGRAAPTTPNPVLLLGEGWVALRLTEHALHLVSPSKRCSVTKRSATTCSSPWRPTAGPCT